MYMVIRKFKRMRSVAEAARRAESGIGQVLKQGSVATADVGRAKAGRGRWSCGYAEQGSNEVALRPHIIRWCAHNLPLADHRHRLIACNRLRCGLEALEAQTWPDQPLDAPVILLDDIVQELHLPEFGEPPELSGTFHRLRRYRIGGILVDRDSPRTDGM